ncbi:MAG: YkgJ family cysteine cluster protein [Promethearchaeota archaeon]
MEIVTQHIDTIIFTRFDILTQFGGSFTLNIPFLCQQCGQCCREISFPDSKNLHNVIRSLRIDILQLSKQFLKNGKRRDHSEILSELCQIKPCIFLQEDLCRIYTLRPLICREWYPWVKSKCPAYLLHNKMSLALLHKQKYRIGTREMIFIGKRNPNPSYPLVSELREIDENTLLHYYSPPENELIPIWETFLSFNPSSHERLIFKTINPALRLMD